MFDLKAFKAVEGSMLCFKEDAFAVLEAKQGDYSACVGITVDLSISGYFDSAKGELYLYTFKILK